MNLLEFLQIQTKEISKDRVILSLQVTDCHKQPFGLLHGGMNGVLIETACSIGANEHFDTKKNFAVGIDLQVNHLKSVADGNLTIIATPDHIGNSLQIWEGKIYNDQHELTSIGRCTLMNKNHK
ncbi:PaaI family thioesterase [Enterococcus sp. LJL99]